MIWWSVRLRLLFLKMGKYEYSRFAISRGEISLRESSLSKIVSSQNEPIPSELCSFTDFVRARSNNPNTNSPVKDGRYLRECLNRRHRSVDVEVLPPCTFEVREVAPRREWRPPRPVVANNLGPQGRSKVPSEGLVIPPEKQCCQFVWTKSSRRPRSQPPRPFCTEAIVSDAGHRQRKSVRHSVTFVRSVNNLIQKFIDWFPRSAFMAVCHQSGMTLDFELSPIRQFPDRPAPHTPPLPRSLGAALISGGFV